MIGNPSSNLTFTSLVRAFAALKEMYHKLDKQQSYRNPLVREKATSTNLKLEKASARELVSFLRKLEVDVVAQ